MENKRRGLRPSTIRSRMIIEPASELVGSEAFPDRQARITFREEGGLEWNVCMFGSDTPDVIEEMARGEVHIAIINPSMVLNLALRGTGPFKEPIPVRAITVIPSYDQFAFAVAGSTGLTSLEEIRDRHFPLRVSLRGEPKASVHLVTNEVLAAVGFSLDDIIAWGGEVRYDPGLPEGDNRIGALRRGEVDAIFDEAIRGWTTPALEAGMRILPLEEPLLQRMEAIGLVRAFLEKSRFPKLPADVPTLDFSGWPVYTHASVSDEIITAYCSALEARKDRIRLHEGNPLPLETMCRDTPDGPLRIPLHPAAERFWRQCGYLS